MDTLIMCMFIILPVMTSGDSISPQQTAESRTEGESVTLTCSYTASSNNVYLYWYRKNSNRALEYILYKGARSSTSSHIADFAKSRFTSTADSSSTTITISKLALSDTAIYHCALRIYDGGYAGTAGTWKLTFGNGSKLFVEPTKDTKPSKPSLSVFTPPKKGDPAACVATGFFPNDVNISMSVGHGAPKVTASIDKAVLSMTDKTYNFAAFLTVDEGNDQEVTCKANEKIKKSIKNDKSADEPAPMSPALNCTTNGTSTDGVTIESIHLNFKSLTLQGLRVMFVKTVAFNFLMTVRALMF